MEQKPGTRIRVLLVAHGLQQRELVQRAIEDCEDIELVAAIPNGKSALARMQQLRPEVILLGTDIPDLTPEQFVQALDMDSNQCGVILLAPAAPHPETVERTLHGLEQGAFDFVEWPEQGTEEERIALLHEKLCFRVRTFSIRRYSRIARQASRHDTDLPPVILPADQYRDKLSRKQHSRYSARYRLVAIGVSTGGPDALRTLLPCFPDSFPLPILVTIHLPAQFTASLARKLNTVSSLRVREAQEGDSLQPGVVYISRGNRHMLVHAASGHDLQIGYNDDPPVNSCKPSIDVLFRSLTGTCQGDVVAVILTGMGEDGVRGLGELQNAGAHTIAQDEASSVVWGMPGDAVRAGYATDVLPLSRIPERIMELLYGSSTNGSASGCGERVP